MPGTFVIIDGSSLAYRAFYALPLLQNAAGQYTNAVYGFTTMLLKLQGELKAERMAVAFDKGKITFRNEVYAEYKGTRKATPPELSAQFPVVKDWLNALGVATLEIEGYEADDIIGTLAAKAEAAGYEVIIVTGDRDALQLITDKTRVLLTRKGISDLDCFDAVAFEEKYGVAVAQQIDLKGLMGDSSDNIPGVPGVGEKTAVKLIREYGSIENVLENIENISGKKLQENLRNNRELALLSKQLATIIRDVPLEFVADSFQIAPNYALVQELCARLEFRNLISKLESVFPGNGETAAPAAPLPLPILRTVETAAAWQECVGPLASASVVPLISGAVPDLVWQGLLVNTATEVVYVPAGVPAWEQAAAWLQNPAVTKITHDAKRLVHACLQNGWQLAGLQFDTLLAAYLLEPTASAYPLPDLAERYLGETAGLSAEQAQDALLVAAVEAQQIQRLAEVLEISLKERELTALFTEVELPLVTVLAAMEQAGIHVDTAYLATMATEIAAKIEILLQQIYELAGEEFNVNSPKQLGVILFEKLNLPVLKKTKTGYSTDAEVLEKLAGEHPLIDKLLEYRMLTKLKSTYLDGLSALVHPRTKRIHTHFNQVVTATGRLSSSEPNLQNIPIRTEVGRKIRELFIPGEGYQYLMAADYSQIELRVLAAMSNDPGLMDAFRANQDIHTRTASEVFEVPMAAVTSDLRARAKAVNFGIVYGISDFGLSRDLGVSRKEAGQYINSYFAKYAGVQSFMDSVVRKAHEEGFVTTLFGRRRYLPDINSSNFNQRSFAERMAMNTPIQGTAADIIKKAMIAVQQALTARNLRSRILLQVHDELVLEVVEGEVDIVAAIVKESMEGCVALAVPLVADVKKGPHWAATK